jgi:hypothetical protein
MMPDLSDNEKRALIELLTTIEDDLYPLSPRIRTPWPNNAITLSRIEWLWSAKRA